MESFFTLENIFNFLFNSIYFIIILSTIIVVILDNRSPVKTLAWILVLFFLPVVGLSLYFLIGRSTKRERIISKNRFTKIFKRPMERYQTQKALNLDKEDNKLMNFFKNVNHALPFDGNQVDIYTNGSDMICNLIKEISLAKHHIHMEFYIFDNDSVGRLIRDALIDKAKQGVEIRILFDDVGNWKVKQSFYDMMRFNGIEVKAFLRVRFPLFTSKVNYRNHRKLVIIDGKTAFIGGMNIAKRYVKGVKWGNWRDTHLKIKGKSVYGIQTTFLTDWFVVDRSLITSAKYFPEINDMGNKLVQIVTSDPLGEWHTIMQGLNIAFTEAKRYIFIQTPYLLPTETILSALQTAAIAGVDVRIMIPQKADSIITHLGTLSYLEDFIDAGVKILFYKKGFLHSKSIVIDDEFSTVGSTNMDFRSFEHNFEANAIIYNKEIALKLKEVFLSDQKHCKTIQKKEWDKRPISQRLKESVVRIISPVL